MKKQKNYQFCFECDDYTDKCEEDSLLSREGNPLCERCFDKENDSEIKEHG